MKISCITREDWFNKETLKTKPGSGSGGGGIVTKYLSLMKCCPDIHFTSDFGDPNLRPIVLIEPLVIKLRSAKAMETALSKAEKLESHTGVKLLWCEEQTVFRWDHEVQHVMFEAVDGLLACNQYQKQLLETLPFDKPIYTLYTPIDDELYYPEPKKKQVIVASKVGYQKNTAAIIELFDALSDDIRTVYIGSAEMWGGKSTYEYDKEFEKELSRAADTYIKSASPVETAEWIRKSAAGLNISIYDVGSLFFLETVMAGGDFFAWNYHPMFNEYQHVKRFDTVKDGASLITETLENVEPNTALRDEVMAKHSFASFKRQLGAIIQEVFVNG